MAGFYRPLETVWDTPPSHHRLLELKMLLYEANNIEEPCAGKPHAGICERSVR